jgi:hypothetical protein
VRVFIDSELVRETTDAVVELDNLEPSTTYICSTVVVNAEGESDATLAKFRTLGEGTGKLYAWGSNATGHIIANGPALLELPQQISEADYYAVSTCSQDSVLLTSEGDMVWGSGGQLTPLMLPVAFTQVTCSDRYTLLISTHGHIYAFGD